MGVFHQNGLVLVKGWVVGEKKVEGCQNRLMVVKKWPILHLSSVICCSSSVVCQWTIIIGHRSLLTVVTIIHCSSFAVHRPLFAIFHLLFVVCLCYPLLWSFVVMFIVVVTITVPKTNKIDSLI
jgi:hypothetical protein